MLYTYIHNLSLSTVLNLENSIVFNSIEYSLL